VKDTATHPGAPEVNDGQDNQCAGDPGYGIVDEIDGVSGFVSPGDTANYSWPAQGLATSYEVARSSDPTFASDCTTFSTATTSISDPAVPDLGGVFFYLLRSVSPHVGSWGRGSAGVERTTSCP
jgi:hypothetical protein